MPTRSVGACPRDSCSLAWLKIVKVVKQGAHSRDRDGPGRHVPIRLGADEYSRERRPPPAPAGAALRARLVVVRAAPRAVPDTHTSARTLVTALGVIGRIVVPWCGFSVQRKGANRPRYRTPPPRAPSGVLPLRSRGFCSWVTSATGMENCKSSTARSMRRSLSWGAGGGSLRGEGGCTGYGRSLARPRPVTRSVRALYSLLFTVQCVWEPGAHASAELLVLLCMLVGGCGPSRPADSGSRRPAGRPRMRRSVPDPCRATSDGTRLTIGVSALTELCEPSARLCRTRQVWRSGACGRAARGGRA